MPLASALQLSCMSSSGFRVVTSLGAKRVKKKRRMRRLWKVFRARGEWRRRIDGRASRAGSGALNPPNPPHPPHPPLPPSAPRTLPPACSVRSRLSRSGSGKASEDRSGKMTRITLLTLLARRRCTPPGNATGVCTNFSRLSGLSGLEELPQEGDKDGEGSTDAP
jgi:hypothetical protein